MDAAIEMEQKKVQSVSVLDITNNDKTYYC